MVILGIDFSSPYVWLFLISLAVVFFTLDKKICHVSDQIVMLHHGMNDRLDNLSSEIESLESKISDLESTISAIDNSVDELSKKLDSIISHFDIY